MKEKDKIKAIARELQCSKWQRDSAIQRAHSDFNQLLEEIPIKAALEWWKAEMEESTEARPETISEIYEHIISLINCKVIDKSWDIDLLNKNQKHVLHQLVNNSEWDEFEKKSKLNALMSFVNFLHEQTKGYIRRLQAPSELKLQNTIRASSPKALTLKEWWRFRDELEKISERDALVAKLMAYTARPLNEVLELTVNDLDFSANLKVMYKNGDETLTVQTDGSVAEQMRKYLAESEAYRREKTDYLFITRNGNRIYRTHFTKIFEKASLNADLGFKVTAKMIQWTYASDLLQSMILTRNQIKELLNIKHIPRNLEI